MFDQSTMLVFLLLALRAIPLLASEAVKIGLVLSPTQSPHPRLHLQGKPHSNVQIDLVRLNVGAGNPYETIEYLRAEICDKEISGLIYAVSPDNIDTFLRYPIAAYVAMVAEKLGIPIITAVTSDLAQQSTGTNTSIFHIQASPEDIGHSMLKLLDHFGWNHATVITGSDPVSLNFATQMEYLIQEKTSWKKISVKTLDFNTDIKVDIMDLSDSYYSIFVIYASLAEAKEILLTARECNILRKGFVWIVAGSVMDSLTGKHIPDEFPTGLIGLKHRDLKYGLKERIDDALSSYLEAIVSYSNLGCKPLFLGPPGCESNTIEEVKWHSETCLNYQPQDIFSEFGENGYLLTPEIVVINTHENGYFKQVGVWQNNTLELESITWLGHSARSQQRMSGPGSDLKERLKVVTVEEVPFVNIIDAAEYSYEKCTTGMVCRIANTSDADYVEKCCGGYAMDLLKELSRKVDGGFEFDLYVRKHYGRYLESEQWNGVVGDLVYGRADSMVGGLKLSSQRQKVLDFSVPFMTSGVTVIVEQSRGNTPPKAVWDPFDFMVWIMALCVALITTSLIVFFFEWYSPTGYAMSVARPRGSHFTVGDSIWMTWALTFNNSLPHRVPKSFSGKFMGTVWAFYSLVFIALYTANLTAHMIKVEKKLPITGFMDPKIQNPQASYPPIKFATVNSTNTESLIATHNPRMHTYMKADLVETAEQGIEYLDSGKLDVFIYDTMVSEYLASRDRQCDLVTVDSAFAMTGYAIAFTKGSPWREKIDKALLQLSENGVLHTLREKWITLDSCIKRESMLHGNDHLGPDNVSGAFFFLSGGLVASMIVICCEYLFYKYLKTWFVMVFKEKELVSLIAESISKVFYPPDPEVPAPPCGKCYREILEKNSRLQETYEKIKELESMLESRHGTLEDEEGEQRVKNNSELNLHSCDYLYESIKPSCNCMSMQTYALDGHGEKEILSTIETTL